MIAVDTPELVLGFSIGVLLSVCFFVGLAYGVRLALCSSRPATVLLTSFVSRISVLLASGYYLVIARGNVWSLGGFVMAFVLVRLLVILWNRTTSNRLTQAKEIR